ncbi:AAA family ATPase [Luteipulveratus mongoliensis]|uniref:Uncharacterized protein n=1 Tax=Luteipulveratus mongoliensis TaxID=571913 RepID=A0A0K1JHA9_9MICO|nr:AAA family ATPase [Luteipulveratus mongoliensis]AKU15973.1 hypothetical protein VV02_09095 [Luteipulveratus mongoliensis]
MPRLIVLNGPPAVGKSTLAARYADDHPLALNLDLDRVHLLLGGADDNALDGYMATRDLAAAMARTHLQAGHDVVVPQYLARPLFLERLEALAGEIGAAFHEIVLLDSLQRLEARFAHRSATSAEPEHQLAARAVATGGEQSLPAMRARLVELVATRPLAVVIDCPEGQEDTTYRAILHAVGEA